MRKIRLAVVIAVAAWLLTVAPALAIWPTTCVEANDAFEYAAGRLHNVGIYQRVYPDPVVAEAACQNDHRDDLRRAFAWAFRNGQPQSTAAPTNLREHPDWSRVRDVAQARSTDFILSPQIADSVIQRGAVDAFLQGVDEGVQYGRWSCDQSWRSMACPLAPEQPAGRARPPSTTDGPRVDPTLRPAWDVLRRSDAGSQLIRLPGNEAVVEIDWAADLPGTALAGWAPNIGLIGISPSLRGERPEVLAAIIAHEFWHAVSPIPDESGFDNCVADEVRAFITQAAVWQDISPGTLRTALEQAQARLVDVWLSDPGDEGRSMPEDVSGYPGLRAHALYDYNYVTTCAA
ncbi:MAG: hypothetical protein OXR64_04420 [Chloroflexota bacterium]|nr:hypothetical protein [Chloroflexota bacterium]MDE2919071.1 hypothetical protein [Chloroflexota bacterium]